MTIAKRVTSLANGHPVGITAQVIDLVGPKGYVHGWIFLGVPATGDTVYHPHLGSGTVTGHTLTRVSVAFDKAGAVHSFEHADREDGQAPRFVSRDEHEGAFGRSAATVLGTSLESDGSATAGGYRSSLHYVPEPFLRALKKFGTRVILTTQPVGGSEKDMADKRPRGYPEGMTWKDSGGAYRPDLKRAIAGNTVGTGSVDVTLHEVSHGVDHALGYPSAGGSHERAYDALASAAGPDLKPYYGSGHDTKKAAMSEFFAETMAAWMKHEGDAPDKRVDAMIAAVAPGVSGKAVERHQRIAAALPVPVAAERAQDTARRNARAVTAMADVARLYQERVAEAEMRLGQR